MMDPQGRLHAVHGEEYTFRLTSVCNMSRSTWSTVSKYTFDRVPHAKLGDVSRPQCALHYGLNATLLDTASDVHLSVKYM